MSISFQTMAALRFGTGFRPGEAVPADKQALLAQLKAGIGTPPMFPVGGLDARRKTIGEVADRLQAIRKGNDPDETKRARQSAIFHQLDTIYQRDADARIAQAVFSPNGFYERLASFWVNHFSVSAQKAEEMRMIVPLFEAEAIRPNIGAPFPVLLKAVTRHPAMLIYLDQSQSQGPDSPAGIKQKKGLNENLARELIELHTLGAGSGYTQTDVRSAAMVLTGIALDRQALAVDFKPGMSEPGDHAVLGVTYGGKQRREGDYLAMLDDLALHPKTAQHICRKLVAHFVSDQPPQAVIDVMTDCWKNTKGDLTAVYATMLDHPDAWSGEGSKARAPFDFVVAGLRALDLPRNPLAVNAPLQSFDVVDAQPVPAAAMSPAAATSPAAASPPPPPAAGGTSGAAPPGEATAAAAGAATATAAGAAMAAPPKAAVATASAATAPKAAIAAGAMSGGSMSGGAVAGAPPPSPSMADAQAQQRKQEEAAFDATLYVPRGLGLYALKRMGEPVWEPPSPAGFPDSFDAWINASALSERLAWSRRAAGRYGKQDDPRQFLKDTLGDAARDDTIRIVSQAPNRMTGLTLVLASPEFNRR